MGRVVLIRAFAGYVQGGNVPSVNARTRVRNWASVQSVPVGTRPPDTEATVRTPIRTSPDAFRPSTAYAHDVNHPEPDPGAAVVTDPSRSPERPGSEVHPTPRSAATDDAVEVLRRIETDEQAARDARHRYGEAAITPLEDVPPTNSPVLATGESVYAFRLGAVLNAGRSDVPGYSGLLLLTGTRLVLDGQVTITIPLADITETALAGERLLLSLRNGEGLTLDVGQPRLLRAEIGAVREAGRA